MSIAVITDQMNTGALLLRLCLGSFLAYHGFNKVFGPSGLSGTSAWFAGIGFKWSALQARIAASTEIASGVLFTIGLITPLAAAGIVGVMLVAIVVAHRKVGFFVFLPGQGWEYCATIAVGALVVATVGPGQWSVDHALGWTIDGWTSPILCAAVGIGAAFVQLAVSYRPAHRNTGSNK